MNVDVNKLKSDFTSKVGKLYNQETYFIDSCEKFPSKYTLEDTLSDLSLRILFEENNVITINGKCVKYCDKQNKKKIRLFNISNDVYFPEESPVINYIVQDDTWKKIDW